MAAVSILSSYNPNLQKSMLAEGYQTRKFGANAIINSDDDEDD